MEEQKEQRMAIKCYDRNMMNVVYAGKDTDEPRTGFHIRTLTLSQRARCLELAGKLSEIAQDVSIGTGEKMNKMVPVAMALWEMLVVNVTMVGVDVAKRQGEFGMCVPGTWFDEVIGDFDVLMDVIGQGIAVNTASAEEKKTRGDLCTGGSGLENLTVGSALRTDGRQPEGADRKAE